MSDLDLGSSDDQPREPRPAVSGNPLDLGATPTAPTPTSPHSETGDLLDLGSSRQLAAPAAVGARDASGRIDLRLPTVDGGQVRQLSSMAPVVWLVGPQVAGQIVINCAVPNPYDLILVCAYETTDGREGIAVPSLRPAGPDPAHPIFSVSTEVIVDVARIGEVSRFFVVGVPRRGDLRLPGGTLVVQAADRTRLDVPMGSEVTLGAKALLTAYVVEDGLAVRAEHDPYSGTLHQVCDAYGYSELSWRDDFTPL